MAQGQSGYQAVRVRNRPAERNALVEYLERHEPWSSNALAYVMMEGLRRTRCRGWTVSSADGTVVGAVVVYSPCLARWQVYSAMDDDGAAEAIAAVVQRCPAVHYAGAAEHIVPVLPHIARLHSARTATFVSSSFPPPPPPNDTPLDERTRFAVPGDLDGIVAVFETFGIGIERTKWQLRSAIKRTLSRLPVVVFELDGRIVGAFAFTGITRHWIVADQVVVHPDARGRGVSWRLSVRAMQVNLERGLPLCGIRYPTNPMTIDRYEVAADGWVYAGMYEQSRFRGHARLRELLFKFQALEDNTNPMFHAFDELPYGDGYRDPSVTRD